MKVHTEDLSQYLSHSSWVQIRTLNIVFSDTLAYKGKLILTLAYVPLVTQQAMFYT
jgi:hypothetical protein